MLKRSRVVNSLSYSLTVFIVCARAEANVPPLNVRCSVLSVFFLSLVYEKWLFVLSLEAISMCELYSKSAEMSARLHGEGRPVLSSLGVQHFNEQVVAGHVAVQVLVVKVLLGLQADRSDLRQPEEQLAELVRLLRVVAHDVVQERRVDLLLDTFHQVEVLQVFHIYRRKEQD